MNKINLHDLFYSDNDKLPEWINAENVIYKIQNELNGHIYIGQTTLLKRRFRGPGFNHKDPYEECLTTTHSWTYLYNALRKYKAHNFSVSIIEKDVADLNSREIYWIAFYNTYLGEGYNMTSGGDRCEPFIKAGHTKMKELYPETNGMPVESARKSLIERYPNTNGVSPTFILNGIVRTKQLNPEYNGVSRKMIDAGLASLKLLYPDTNGVPPQFIKAGHARMKELYPDSNGMPIESARRSLLERYPDTKGIPPQMIKSSKLARLQKYPNTNGAPTEWIQAGLSTMNSPEALQSRANDKRFESIVLRLNNLYSSGLPISSINFKKVNQDGNITRWIKGILWEMDHLSHDPRWTEDMQLIFSNIKINANGKLVFT